MGQPTLEQAVLDDIHPHRRLAHDAHQHIALVIEQVIEQRQRRREGHALLYRLAQTVDRAQGMDTGADNHTSVHGEPERLDLGWIKRRLVGHVIDDGGEAVSGLLNARRARSCA